MFAAMAGLVASDCHSQHAPVGGADYAGGVPDAGGITGIYRSWRGVRQRQNRLLLQNWTLSVIFSAGLVAFNNDF